MKKMKLFPKIFLYTFIIMLFIIIITHFLIYSFAPQMTFGVDHIAENGVYIENSVNSTNLISQAILRSFPMSLIISIIIALLCSYIFSKIITQPIKEITNVTQEMALLKVNTQCDVYTQDEIGILASNINQLYHNLTSTIINLKEEKEKTFQSEKLKLDFLRTASHELKTPITALNAILENMILGVGKYKNTDIYLLECQKITNDLSHMIKEILDTSRLDFMKDIQDCEVLNIENILSSVCEPYQLIAKMKGITFNTQIIEPCILETSKDNFEKIISNIVSNAVAYTNKGDHIQVQLYSNRLLICNECLPISSELISHLFEPFYRPDFSRNKEEGGNGLGLYIVDVLCKKLNIRYSFEYRNDIQGMCFILYFDNLS